MKDIVCYCITAAWYNNLICVLCNAVYNNECGSTHFFVKYLIFQYFDQRTIKLLVNINCVWFLITTLVCIYRSSTVNNLVWGRVVLWPHLAIICFECSAGLLMGEVVKVSFLKSKITFGNTPAFAIILRNCQIPNTFLVDLTLAYVRRNSIHLAIKCYVPHAIQSYIKNIFNKQLLLAPEIGVYSISWKF